MLQDELGINRVLNIFRVSELRKRIGFTLMVLLVFRIGGHIPTPGINLSAIQHMTQNTGGLFAMLDLFTGGGLKRMTIFAFGIMPYIQASIILQLLQVVIDDLKKMSESKDGRKKMQELTRYATIVITIVQTIMVAFWLKNQTTSGEGGISFLIKSIPFPVFLIMAIFTLVAGQMVLVWLGEQITEKGIGNGISLIIFAGIVSRIPAAIGSLITQQQTNATADSSSQLIQYVMILLVFMFIVAFVVYMEQAQRRVPLQYSKRIVGRRVYGVSADHLPIKLNPAGVIPIIFASAVMVIFPAIGNMLARIPDKPLWLQGISATVASTSGWFFYSVQFTLIVFFCYFYTAVTFNPEDITKNIYRMGGSIPGLSQNNAALAIQKLLNRVIFPGAVFLGFIATLPAILYGWMKIPQGFAYLMGGTSLIIIVGVALDTMKQIESQLIMRHYPGLLRHGKLKGRR